MTAPQNTTVHLAPTPVEDVDDLLLDLINEFKAAPKAKKSGSAVKAAEPTYFPPAPKWRAVAITLMVVEQQCKCCGETHHFAEGTFIESEAEGSTARRFVPYSSSVQTPELGELPRRKDIRNTQVEECYDCFGLEEQLLRIAHAGAPYVPSATLQLTPFDGDSDEQA